MTKARLSGNMLAAARQALREQLMADSEAFVGYLVRSLDGREDRKARLRWLAIQRAGRALGALGWGPTRARESVELDAREHSQVLIGALRFYLRGLRPVVRDAERSSDAWAVDHAQADLDAAQAALRVLADARQPGRKR